MRVAVWLGYGPERPQFSRVGVAVWLVCGPERLQFSRVGVAEWLGCGPEWSQFSRFGVAVWLGCGLLSGWGTVFRGFSFNVFAATSGAGAALWHGEVVTVWRKLTAFGGS